MNTCSVCKHPDRVRIDASLVEGTPLRDIAGQNGVSKSALERHAKHLPSALTAAKQASVVAEATTLLDHVKKLIERSYQLANGAERDGQWSGAVAALGEVRRGLELLGKLSGELQASGPQVAVAVMNGAISIRDLSGQQLDDLITRIEFADDAEKNAMGSKLGLSPVINVRFVKPEGSEDHDD